MVIIISSEIGEVSGDRKLFCLFIRYFCLIYLFIRDVMFGMRGKIRGANDIEEVGIGIGNYL